MPRAPRARPARRGSTQPEPRKPAALFGIQAQRLLPLLLRLRPEPLLHRLHPRGQMLPDRPAALPFTHDPHPGGDGEADQENRSHRTHDGVGGPQPMRRARARGGRFVGSIDSSLVCRHAYHGRVSARGSRRLLRANAWPPCASSGGRLLIGQAGLGLELFGIRTGRHCVSCIPALL